MQIVAHAIIMDTCWIDKYELNVNHAGLSPDLVDYYHYWYVEMMHSMCVCVIRTILLWFVTISLWSCVSFITYVTIMILWRGDHHLWTFGLCDWCLMTAHGSCTMHCFHCIVCYDQKWGNSIHKIKASAERWSLNKLINPSTKLTVKYFHLNITHWFNTQINLMILQSFNVT
jgi:hypothetical protein